MIELFKIGFITIKVTDLLDISIMALIFYHSYQFLKKSYAFQGSMILLGIFIIWKLADVFKLLLLSTIIGEMFQVIIVILVVVFGQDLKRTMIMIRDIKWYKQISDFLSKPIPIEIDLDKLLVSVDNLSKKKIGALIVIQNKHELNDVLENSYHLRASLSSDIIEAIFQKNSPMHDGAIVIQDNNIIAARCVLPTSMKQDFPTELGLRHRSALGLAESTDAIIIILSEDTGRISVAYNATLDVGLKMEELKILLYKITKNL